MHREDRFVLSRKQYAVNLSTLTGEELPLGDGTFYDGRITAVWYRRRRGTTIACIGRLWDLQDTTPKDAREFLERHADGRHGGVCEGRWDGEGYWGAQEPEEIAAHLELLRPMLADYPTIPAGYDGWWRF